MDKSVVDVMSVSKENVAAILALLGKELSTTKSPTAIVMLENLKENMSVLFHKMVTYDHDVVTVRLGDMASIDDRYFMFCRIDKTNKITEMQALAKCMNTIIQENQSHQVNCEDRKECTDCYEFVISVYRVPYT